MDGCEYHNQFEINKKTHLINSVCGAAQRKRYEYKKEVTSIWNLLSILRI